MTRRVQFGHASVPGEVLLAWVALDDVDAEAALVRAVGACLSESFHPLAYARLIDEVVRDALEKKLLATSDRARAAALSDAETAVAAHVR